MSPKATKHRLVAKRKKNSIFGMLAELYLKEYDARNRLANNVCVFIKLGNKRVFFVLSDDAPNLREHGKFFSAAIGASRVELGEADDLLNELEGNISDLYSPSDFHPTVALYFLSRYLKGTLEEFWSSKTLAVEFMILDPLLNILYAVEFNGNYESYSLEDEHMFVTLGAYNPKLRKELNQEIQSCLSEGDISSERLGKVGEKLCKKYHLQVAALMNVEVVDPGTPKGDSVTKQSDNP